MSRLIYIVIILSTALIFPQQDSTNSSEIIENILEKDESEQEDNNLYESLEQLSDNPVNINTADLFELQKVPYIDNSIANLILDYRKKYGYFFSVNELNLVKGINSDIIKMVKPFLIVKDEKYERNDFGTAEYEETKIKLKLRSRVQTDIQKERGYREGIYIGSPYKTYTRMQGKLYDKYKIGLLFEKDPGERKLTDFNSFFISAENVFFMDELIGGDFLVEFGQGLALWSPYGFSKSSDAVLPVKKNAGGLKAYASTDENRFFRGAAAKMSYYNYSLTCFFSTHTIDARVDSLSSLILSVPVDGYHRTVSETRKQGAIEETNGGVIINKSFSNYLRLGLLFYHTKFSNNFLKDDLYSLSENNFNTISFSYDLNLDNFNLMGEAAVVNKTYALINGLIYKASKDFSYSFLIRYYPANYKNIHGSAFGESGLTKNEFGIFTGIKWRTFLGTINFYFDQFRFPYKTYNTSLPSSGYEVLFDLTSKPIKNLVTHIKFKYENKELNITNDEAKLLLQRNKYQLRGEFNYKISRWLEVKNRVEYSFSKYDIIKDKNDGYLFFSELKYKPTNLVQTAVRFIFFNTDSYNSAIYEYESDLTGIMTNLPMYGEGYRWYIVIKYNLAAILKLSLKYSETIKNNVVTLGSGYSEIRGGLDNKISLQIDFNY